MNILALDDEIVTLSLLKGLLVSADFSVTAVSNATDALQHIREHPSDIDLLITNINMPGMNGFDLLKAVRKKNPVLPVIVLTSREDRETVRHAMQLGANDYLDKPIRKDELLKSIERVIRTSPKRHLDQSFNTRREVQEAQRTLMQSPSIQRLAETGALALWQRPVSDAGGDFIYGHSEDSNRHTLILVDAAGHDISSSYYVAECKGLIEALIGPELAPADFMEHFNRKLLASEHARHICAFILSWNLSDGLVRLANAGLPHGFLWRANEPVRPLRLDGAILGLLDAPAFDSADIHLAPGDRLLFFTDGVESFGEEERLAATWQSIGRPPLDEALKQLVQTMNFEAPDVAQDDLLLLALEQPPISTASPAAEIGHLRIRMHSDRRAIEPSIRRILDFVRDMSSSLTADLAERIATTLRELVSNAILHGNRERMDALVTLSARIKTDQLILRVSDEGEGFELDKELTYEQSASPLRNGKRGLLTAAHYSDSLSKEGQAVQAVFRL